MEMIDLIAQFFKDMPRQGPGSQENTSRALSFIPNLPENAKILDVGCGTGAQTLVLAQETQNIHATIHATDTLPIFLDILQQKTKTAGLENSVCVENVSMMNLPYSPETFDLIWGEGSIYLMGFENGIRSWRPFLKPGGFLAVSEISWLTASRPQELENYWKEIYTDIDLTSRKIALLEENGYTPVAHFVFPDDCWTTHYYNQIRTRIPNFLSQYADEPKISSLIEEFSQEAEMYHRFGKYYSYVFYIAQKNEDPVK
ncbi:MAG: class I SAM-dependent methyltransferase [Planctomycetia bacterium]|nr:class I SAM-dependent methyltransferase [Planctomycetia bacterium]